MRLARIQNKIGEDSMNVNTQMLLSDKHLDISTYPAYERNRIVCISILGLYKQHRKLTKRLSR